MNEPKPIYRTAIVEKLAPLFEGEGGEIKRAQLWGNMAAAFACDSVFQGLLTISRPAVYDCPSGKDIENVLTAFRGVSGDNGRPVLAFKEISREIVRVNGKDYHAVRLAVYYGEQGRLL